MMRQSSAKRVKSSISQDDWGAMLQEAMRPKINGKDNYMTTRDIVAATGIAPERVRLGLVRMMALGRLVVEMRSIPSVCGLPRSVPFYAIKEGKI